MPLLKKRKAKRKTHAPHTRRQVRPEKHAENKTVREAFKLGVRSSKLALPGQRHWPDRIFWLPGGKPFLIEFKKENKKPTRAQAEHHKKLLELGYDVEVHTDAGEALGAIQLRLYPEEATCPISGLPERMFRRDED